MRTTLVLAAVAALASAGCSGGSTGPAAGSGGGGGGGNGGGVYGGGRTQCPANTVCMVNTSFEPGSITVTRNASVSFLNGSGIVHNVTFAAVPSPGVTNIPNHGSGENARTFATAGTFGFECTLHAGMNGQVVVQ